MKDTHLPRRFMLACITGLLITIQFSCQRLPKPRFTYEPMEDPEAGEVIQFFNESKRGDSYFWEFGDGGVSTLTDPQHSFEQAGIYSVTLTASADQGEAYNTERITIFEPTLLGLIVKDSNGSILEGAAVRVYIEEDDWNNGEEPDYSGTSDHQGWLIFRNLESRIYYIDASMEGNGGQWLFRGYTAPLEINEENWFNVPCVWQSDAPHP